MALKENIRMFQIGEVYNLNPESGRYTNFCNLGTEPEEPHIIDGIEVELKEKTDNNGKTVLEINKTREQAPASKYSRSMLFSRGSGIIDSKSPIKHFSNFNENFPITKNETSADYSVSVSEVLTVRFFLKWKEKPMSSHVWLQKPIFCALQRSTPTGGGGVLKLEDEHYACAFKVTDDWYYVRIVVNNPAGKFKIDIYNPIRNEEDDTVTYPGIPITFSTTISARKFNLSTEQSYIYLGINPYRDFDEPAMLGITPIVDDLSITIANEEDKTGPLEAVETAHNKLPLFYHWFKEPRIRLVDPGILRIY